MSQKIKLIEYLKNIKAFIWDLDGVLGFAYNQEFHDHSMVQAVKTIQHLYKKGRLTDDQALAEARRSYEVYNAPFKSLFMDHNVSPKQVIKHYYGNMCLDFVKPLDDEQRQNLFIEGMQHGILTQSDNSWARKIIKPRNIADVFDDESKLTTSNDFKPSRKAKNTMPYVMAAIKLGVQPSQAIMIDDKLHNLEQAAKVGMTTIWISNAKSIKSYEASNGPTCYKSNFTFDYLEDLGQELKEIRQAYAKAENNNTKPPYKDYTP